MAALDVVAWGSAMAATSDKLLSRINTFPNGQIIAKSGQRLIGFVNSQKLNSSISYLEPKATWPTVTGHGFIDKEHRASGSVLFLINLTVDFKVNELGLSRSEVGSALIDHVLDLARKEKISTVEGITRLNGFREYSKRESIRSSFAAVSAYIEKVKRKEIRDPALSFHLDQGAEVLDPIENAMPEDDKSLQWGAHIVYRIRNSDQIQ